MKEGRSKILKEFEQRQQTFLDRMAMVGKSLLERESEAELALTSPHDHNLNENAVTPQSDLSRPGRNFTIVTTASLPWFTGTSVNPLLRAAYLTRYTDQINKHDGVRRVTLVIPWLELEEDQQLLYGNHRFKTQQDQEAYIRNWLAEDAGMPDAASPETGLKIIFYPARYHSGMKSIFAMGDIVSLIPDSDVCVLEEPEHLNWYRAPGDGYTYKFNYVIGVVHTNYKEYASSQYHGLWTAPAIAMVSSAMVRAYCHKVIKLSDVLQTFAPHKEETSNTHGVRADFLMEGNRRARAYDSDREPTGKIYFVGKLLWAKGFEIMLDLQDYYKECTGEYFPIDIYGNGPDEKEIMRAFLGRRSDDKKSEEKETAAQDAEILHGSVQIPENISNGAFSLVESLHVQARERLTRIKKRIKVSTESLEIDLPRTLYELRRNAIPATFPGRVDHALLKEEYSIFVNPSVSEVLCTTTAEALAMNKWVIIPVHPSNTFFTQFPNCLSYSNKFEFAANLRWAMTHEPEPLSEELAHRFTWEAATERFIAASAITYKEARERDRKGVSKLDQRIAWFHNELGKGKRGDAVRKLLGGGPVSDQVKYQQILADGDGDEEDSNEGLSIKFFGSSLAKALESTLSKGLPSLLSKTSTG